MIQTILLKLIIFLRISQVASHAGHAHTFSADGDCYASIIGGSCIANEDVYIYGDYMSGTIISYNGTAHVEERNVRVTGIYTYGDDDVIILHATDYGNQLKFLRSPLPIATPSPDKCGYIIDIRTKNNAVYSLDSVSGKVCKMDNTTGEWELFYDAQLSPTFLWEQDYVAVISFEVDKDNNLWFFYSRGEKSTAVTFVNTNHHTSTLVIEIPISGVYRDHAGGFIRETSTGMYLFTGEQFQRSQSSDKKNGKIIKINTDDYTHQVCSVGLRHPWRGDYCPSSNNMIFGDVGDNLVEALYILNDDDLCGYNFGYPILESNTIPSLSTEEWNSAYTRIVPTFHHIHKCDLPTVTETTYVTLYRYGLALTYVLSVIVIILIRELRSLSLINKSQVSVIVMSVTSSVLTLICLIDIDWIHTVGPSLDENVKATRFLQPAFNSVFYQEFNQYGQSHEKNYWDNFYHDLYRMRIILHTESRRNQIRFVGASLGVLSYIIVIFNALSLSLNETYYLIFTFISIFTEITMVTIFDLNLRLTFNLHYDSDTINPVGFQWGIYFYVFLISICFKVYNICLLFLRSRKFSRERTATATSFIASKNNLFTGYRPKGGSFKL